MVHFVPINLLSYFLKWLLILSFHYVLGLTLFAYRSDVDLSKEDILIQEFISDQLLIYGRTFNTGIRTLITSLKPLRAYYIGSDFSHRVSDQPYNASDLRNTATYVTDRPHGEYTLRQVNV